MSNTPGNKPWRAHAPSADEELVVSGMSGRFPECDNIDELSYNLHNKIDMVTEREDRWSHDMKADIPRRKGILKQIHKFDNNFFGIHSKQTKVMDPQGRLLIECAYEAVVDSGINPQTLRGQNIGVFVANSFSESEKAFMHDTVGGETFNLTGNSRAMMANRISYTLGLTGPSFSLDTACSSSMYALDSAFNAIRSGECEAALVCGANLLLHPHTTINFVKLGVLSPSGYCRPFDVDSDGYSRSETICAIFVQKIRDAKRAYAQLVYSQTNCDGYKEEGITFPSSKMQTKLLNEFYGNIDVDPKTIDYVEAHATGTRVGDPEECCTLDTVFCRDRQTPLLVGSVKSSIGHSEASAALSSIVKVMLAYNSGFITPNINITQPRTDIPALAEHRLKVCTERTPLPGPLIAVNTFGFGGANAHCLFKQYEGPAVESIGQLPYLITWAGRTKESVDAVLQKLSSMPINSEYNALLHNVQHDENNANMHRGYGVYAVNGPSKNAECLMQETTTFDGRKRPIVWVFTGMGCQWLGMGTTLMEIPLFRESIERCHRLLKPHGVDLIETITTTDASTFENGVNSFTGIAAIQISLVNILRHLGVTFDYCIGHSVGELGCAYADGCFTEEQMLLAAYARGVVSRETKVVEGAMAAIGLSYNQIKNRLPDSIEVACHNSPDSATISGPKGDVLDFVAKAQEDKIFARDVPCAGVAYHSKYIAAMGPKLLDKMRAIIPKSTKRSPKWLSTSVPLDEWCLPESGYSSPEYHTNNLLKPVLFEEACKLLPENPITIEIAPHGLLQAIVKKAIPTGIHIPLTNRTNKNNMHLLLSALGRVFMNGITMHIDRLYPEVKFPVSSMTPTISPLVKWDHSQDWFINVFETVRSDLNCHRRFIIRLDADEDEFMAGHVIDGRILLPATGYLQMVRDTLIQTTFSRNAKTINVEFENVKFLRATTLVPQQEIELQIAIQLGSGHFELSEGSSLIVTGYVRVIDNPEPVHELQPDRQSDMPIVDQNGFYKELRLRGYHYDGIFKSVQQARVDGSHGKIKWVDNNWPAFMDCLLQMSIISNDSRALYLPTSIRKMRINTQQHYEMLDNMDGNAPVFDVQVFKELDMAVGGGVEIIGLSVSPVSRRKPAGVEVWESHTFVPLQDISVCYSKEDALRTIAQVITENSGEFKVKYIEIDEKENSLPPLIAAFDDVFAKMPLIDADLKIQTSRSIPDLDAKYLLSGDGRTHNNCDILVQKSALYGKTMSYIRNNLKNDGYVLSRESIEVWSSTGRVPNFSVIYALRTADEVLVLLRRAEVSSTPTPVIVEIKPSEVDFDWLPQLQNTINEGPVLLVAQQNRLSGVMGLFNCIRKEPNGHNVRCVFTMDSNAPKFRLNDSFYRDQLNKNMTINVYRNGKWGTYRHLSMVEWQETKPQNSPCWAQISRAGDLSSFVWRTSTIAASNALNIDVHYASINFKDVMIASGRLVLPEISRLQPHMLGFEFSGIDATGDRVMGMIEHRGFITRTSAFEDMVWRVPKEFTLREAATIPVAYITVYYAYFCVNRISKGKSILIHAGSGAVGLAAIRTAIAYGMEVYTTVSTPQKKQFIMDMFPKLKESNIGNSRDTSFENMIKMRTNGRGVDFVLNSLAEEKLLASVRCLGRGGIFLEIGKFDFMNNSNLGMAVFQKEITFRSVFADNLIYRPDMRKIVHALIEKDLHNGIIQPLKSTVFQVDEIEKAFRYLSTGKHMGKVMLQIRATENSIESLPIHVKKFVEFDPDRVYIIPGALGGFGLELIDYMVLRNARILVLSSRRGITNTYQEYRKKLWESYGCKVLVDTNDITTADGCRKLLINASAYGPVGGIFNLAMVLQDNILENQTQDKFFECMAPKAYATKYLDQLSRTLCPQLEYFVVFSSQSCARGNPGQSNYGMSNSVMERIIEERAEQGLPAKAIQWGAIGEVGFFAEMTQNKMDIEVAGTLQQRLSSCLDALDALLTNSDPIVSTIVVAQKKVGSAFSAVDNVLNVMGLTDIKKVPKRTTLVELGMDSLMAVEIKQILEREFDVILSTAELRALTFDKLIEISESKGGKSIVSSSEEDAPAQGNKSSNLLSSFIGQIDAVELDNDLIVQLSKGTSTKAVNIVLIPGIEGIVVGGLCDLGRKITSHNVFALNTQKYCNIQNLMELVESFYAEILNVFKTSRRFILISHSFGASVALELARRLEADGLTGRLLLIDGHPVMVKQMGVNAFEGRDITYTTTIDVIMENFLSLILPDMDLANIIETLSKHKSIETKIAAFEGLPPIRKFKGSWMREFISGLVNRLSMILNASDEAFERIRSPVTLVRPNECSSEKESDKSELVKRTKGPVNVTYVDGSHITMLENGNLLVFINDSYLAN